MKKVLAQFLQHQSALKYIFLIPFYVVKTIFRWCVDNELLQKHHLICPDDYYSDTVPFCSAPKGNVSVLRGASDTIPRKLFILQQQDHTGHLCFHILVHRPLPHFSLLLIVTIGRVKFEHATSSLASSHLQDQSLSTSVWNMSSCQGPNTKRYENVYKCSWTHQRREV